MPSIIEFLTAALESETAVLQCQLEELQALRLRNEVACRQADELKAIIREGMDLAAKPLLRPSPSSLCLYRQTRERVEAALVALESLMDEFQAVQTATNIILAQQALTSAFGAPVVYA